MPNYAQSGYLYTIKLTYGRKYKKGKIVLFSVSYLGLHRHVYMFQVFLCYSGYQYHRAGLPAVKSGTPQISPLQCSAGETKDRAFQLHLL